MKPKNQTEINQTHYFYHHTRIADLKKILEKGLEPRNGIMCRLINDKKTKVSFSESMKGAIIMAAAFQEVFDDIKYGTAWENRTLEEFLGERVFLRFNSDIVENENDVKNDNLRDADGYTLKAIAPEHLRVCLLKNIKTGKISYQRDDILKYMFSINPIESFDEEVLDFLLEYYYCKFNGLEGYNSSDYSLEDIDLCEFLKEYIPNGGETMGLKDRLDPESIFYPSEIGQATSEISEDLTATAKKQVAADMKDLEVVKTDFLIK